jgi:hypothetical protein
MLGISVTELRDLVISLIALAIAFSVLFGGAVLDMNLIIVSTLGVASGFLLHELAHKFTAQHFGYLPNTGPISGALVWRWLQPSPAFSSPLRER